MPSPGCWNSPDRCGVTAPGPAVTPDGQVVPPVETPVVEPPVPDAVPEPTPEEIVADLEPETFEDTGHEATVLDLNAARAARSAELATLEEAATSAALREQLAREQADRDADERAVADALRFAVLSRSAPVAPAAAQVTEPVREPVTEPNYRAPGGSCRTRC